MQMVKATSPFLNRPLRSLAEVEAERCPRCRYSPHPGRVLRNGQYVTCPSCHGTGKQPKQEDPND